MSYPLELTKYWYLVVNILLPTKYQNQQKCVSFLQEERIAQLVRELQIQYFNKQHTKELQNCHTMAASRDINSLPQEILSQILNYLDNSDQRICRFVSPHWSQAMVTSNFYNETVVHLSMLSQEKLRQLLSQTYENTDFKHFRNGSITFMTHLLKIKVSYPGRELTLGCKI